MVYIFMRPFLAHEFNHLLLSARTHVKLVLFEPQQTFQVLAAPSICIRKVTGWMYMLRLYVFRLAFSALQGMFQSQRNFRSFVKSPKTLLKVHSQFMSAHLCCLDNTNCHYLKENKCYIYYLDKARGIMHLQILTLWGNNGSLDPQIGAVKSNKCLISFWKGCQDAGSCPCALHIPSVIMALPHLQHRKKLAILYALQVLDRCQNAVLFFQQELAGVLHLAFETNQIFLRFFHPSENESHSIPLGSAIYPMLRLEYEGTIFLLRFTWLR